MEQKSHQIIDSDCSGTILGLLISPLLIEAVGWRTMFTIYGVVGLPLWALWKARCVSC